MKLKQILTLILSFVCVLNSFSQVTEEEVMLSKIRNEGFKNSKVMDMLEILTDVYGQRLTGSREYLAAATWVSDEMKKVGIQNVHFEKYCDECRGWSIKSFNLEMVSPNYMHIEGYPLAMAKSTKGIVSGEVIHIEESVTDMDALKAKYSGKLKGKIVLLGRTPQKRSLLDTLTSRYSKKQLKEKEDRLTVRSNGVPLPELIKSWETSDVRDKEFLLFVEKEGALAVLTTQSSYLGVIFPQGTYYYRNSDIKPLPYFTIMPEHFGRMVRMLKQNVVPKVSLNLETEFYDEQENNVNIVGEIPGVDSKLKSESILIGAHFDSWHSGTGATDNGANSIVIVEALRILKEIGYTPKRTIKIGLWGGEEQAFLGSVAYARDHFGKLKDTPNSASKKVSAYLNLDNGAGAIRGVYLQDNEFARPVFEHIFNPIKNLSNGAISIDNTFSTDHETFNHYNIPAFQFIQDELAYNTVTHHTQLDLLEYVPENDVMKNAVILAWTIYKLTELEEKVPRKLKE